METTNSKLAEISTIYLRLALAAAYFSSVASRFGLWGEGMGWGNFENFLDYTAKVNPFLPASFIPTVGWIATLAEITLGAMLLIGLRIKEAAFLSGVMLILFAVGMTLGFNVKEPLDYSVERSASSERKSSVESQREA